MSDEPPDLNLFDPDDDPLPEPADDVLDMIEAARIVGFEAGYREAMDEIRSHVKLMMGPYNFPDDAA